MTTAREMMTPDCRCVRSTDTVVDAARMMAELCVGALPIVGEDSRLHGILTDRDITVNVVAQRENPLDVKVGELVDGPLVVAEADDDVSTVMQLMAQHQVRRLPVVENDHLVGIIAQADIARTLSHRDSGEVVEAISQE